MNKKVKEQEVEEKNIDSPEDSKITELTADLQRTRADFENYRRQAESQKEQYGNIVKFAVVKKILPLIDDIERAIAANQEILNPLAKNLEKTIKELGLSKIEANPQTVFNPDIHEAVMVDGEGEEEVIEESLRSGYYYEGVVLRPTLVKVHKK